MYFSSVFIIVIISIGQKFVPTSGERFRPPEETYNSEQESDSPWHPNWDRVTKCERGERHFRFPECWCGQYAKTLEYDEVMYNALDELEREGIHVKTKGIKGRKVYYVCMPCSNCPDGVRVTGYCRQGHDTSCDPNLECVDPDYTFDWRIKACVPNNPQPQENKHKQNNVDGFEDVTKQEEFNSETSSQRSGSPESPRNTTQKDKFAHLHTLIIAAIVVACVVGLGIMVLLGILAHRKSTRKRRSRTLIHVPSDLSQITSGPQHVCMQCMGSARVTAV